MVDETWGVGFIAEEVDELGLTPEQATGRDEPATGVGVDEADDADVATSEPAPAIELDPVAPPAPPASIPCRDWPERCGPAAPTR